MGEVPRRGGEGVLLPSQSLRDSSPRVGAKGERIVTGGNPWKGPHQCEHWFAMTCVYFGAEKAGGQWPPLPILNWLSEVPGDCHTSVATLVRNDNFLYEAHTRPRTVEHSIYLFHHSFRAEQSPPDRQAPTGLTPARKGNRFPGKTTNFSSEMLLRLPIDKALRASSANSNLQGRAGSPSKPGF